MSLPSTSHTSPTYVVELTPTGRGAVAVVLVDGPISAAAVGQFFSAVSKRSLADMPLGCIVVGRWGGPNGEELVVCRRDEKRVEVHCHGGTAAVRSVIDSLVACGCEVISAREWLQQNSADPIETAARIALADAVTARTAALLLDQLNGALSSAIREVITVISSGDLRKAESLLVAILSRRELGAHLTTPWRVVLAGPPNVGKSSLMNALAGYERAIVSPAPGTTRDVVTLSTAIDGWPVELADTAGLREATDELESAGVQLAEAAVRQANVLILVSDASQPAAEFDQKIAAHSGNIPILRVLNKIDLCHIAGGDASQANDNPRGNFVPTSALTGHGIVELTVAIGAALVSIPPPPKAAVPFTPEQVEALVSTREAIELRNANAAIAALQSLLAPANSELRGHN